MKVVFARSFVRAYQKLVRAQPELEKAFGTRLQTFVQNPFEPTLRNHKLKGKLEGSRSFRITQDIRVVFQFGEDDSAVLLDIGTHDDVY